MQKQKTRPVYRYDLLRWEWWRNVRTRARVSIVKIKENKKCAAINVQRKGKNKISS